jgi:uncharacterized membrane protein YvlD (DUF360 family)
MSFPVVFFSLGLAGLILAAVVLLLVTYQATRDLKRRI